MNPEPRDNGRNGHRIFYPPLARWQQGENETSRQLRRRGGWTLEENWQMHQRLRRMGLE